MLTMYCHFTKGQAFPLAFRVSSHSTGCFSPFHTPKSKFLLLGCHPKQQKNLSSSNLICFSHTNYYSPNHSIGLCHETLVRKEGNAPNPRNCSYIFRLKCALQNDPMMRARSFSSLNSQKIVEGGDNVDGAGKTLPWLASYNSKEARRSDNSMTKKTGRFSWEEAGEKFLRSGASAAENREIGRSENLKNDYTDKCDSFEEEERKAGEVDYPRRGKIKNRFNRIVDVKKGSNRLEFRGWIKQEDWGRKTWKEVHESTVPKMIGEGVYGVGPVLAALLAGRREFYALYVQEGLDLSSNNRKKKDKKEFEKILRIAEKIGLSKKEVSKHDLNMVVDSRPHQGVVLDASPLEMVGIKELDPFSAEGEKGPLWVALDEVTDPQNLGAILRSAYFFGAAGVVLCAKNSAPLSGVVSKASAGSLEVIELRCCKNMMQFLTSSADNGWRVLGGSVSSRAVPLSEVLPGAPTILVLGSEGTGLRPLVERSCTNLIRIPGNIPLDVSADGVEDMDHEFSGQEFQSFMAVESLNVSVAAGVLLHHLTCSNYSNSGQSGEMETGITG